MSGEQLHRVQVEPGKAPGGFWVRVCTRERLITEYALTDLRVVESAAEADADLVLDELERGETIWTYFYDGDSGACAKTIITEP